MKENEMNATKIRAVFALYVALAFILGITPGLSRAQEEKDAFAQWPESGTVDFQVSLGENASMPIGQARHTWTHDRAQYQMRLDVETSGVAALLRKLGYAQQSRGLIEKGDLRPQRFDVTQLGKQPEAAVFDWNSASGARVSIRRGERERRHAALQAGDQDLLSIWRQLSLWNTLPESVLVVGNKDSRRVRVTRLADTTLQVPAGHFKTRHFSIRSEDGKIAIELWLAHDRNMLPVRAILADAKAPTLILEATGIHLPKQ